MMQESLFDNRAETTPLADRMRPQTLEEYCGQKHLIAEGKVLRRMIDRDEVQSMIFWGPPGVGKTTLALIIAKATQARFINFSAVTSGIKEIREVMNKAELNRSQGTKTILFVDEIHRFNKAQQDAFLPYVERGSIILIGATTENPSFEINSALLSRCKVFVLNALDVSDIADLIHRAIESPYGFGDWKIEISDEMINMIAAYANGDARTALNTLEMVVVNSETEIRCAVVTKEILEQCISR
ncbi:MAG: AAA family ATPase, partial [Solobacterium sp.]|nr:AAA family ATPase [Solobacterium sp.]